MDERRHRLLWPTSRRVLSRIAVVLAIAAAAMGLGQGVANADHTIEHHHSGTGPFPVTWSEGAPGGSTDNCANQQGDPVGTFTYVYPTNLGALNVPHPVIVWGNGTSANDGTCAYEDWLRYLASWGYVVVAANSGSVGNGDLLVWGGADAIARNGNPSDPFYQKVDTSSIGVAGHSQGALGAINAALETNGVFASVTSMSLPSRAWMQLTEPVLGPWGIPTKAQMDDLDVPVFFLWGTEDSFAIYPTPLVGGPTTPEPQRTVNDWAPPTGPFAAGAIVGAQHADVSLFLNGGGYTIAWNNYTLACLPEAIPAFVATGGSAPEIQSNAAWRHVQLRGLTAAC